MGLLVEVRVSGDAVAVTDVAAAVPAATLELEQWRFGDGQLHWFVWAQGSDLDAVGEGFAALSSVTDVETVSDDDAVRLYRVSMVVPETARPPGRLLQSGAVLDASIRRDGIHVTAQVSSRTVIKELWEFLRRQGLDLETKRLRRTAEGDDGGRLTQPQFEALSTAYEMGYFDESERVTQSEIADELGISRPSVSERLRRAEQRLVEQQLGRAD
jgi:predicted DNA binding protein